MHIIISYNSEFRFFGGFVNMNLGFRLTILAICGIIYVISFNCVGGVSFETLHNSISRCSETADVWQICLRCEKVQLYPGVGI